MNNRLFVYGTLLTPIRNVLQILFPEVEKEEIAYVHGNLFNIGNYPALVLKEGSGKVYGEIYDLPESFSFHELDSYEDFHPEDPENSEYLRVQTMVHLNDDTTTEAWVYVYNWHTEGLEPIASGNYLEFVSENGILN